MSSIHGPQWDRDEEYRQSVIRKALLLGFECHDTGVAHRRFWFTLNDLHYSGYASQYSAAYEFLRLQGLSHLAGDYRG